MIDIPSPSTITVPVNSPLVLGCTSQGSPPDTFTWQKDHGPILQSTGITAVEHTSTRAVFRAYYIIDNVTTSDSGTYRCTVTNAIGSDSATITIVVAGMYICACNRNCVVILSPAILLLIAI